VTGSTGDIDTGWQDFCGGAVGCTKGRLRWNVTVSYLGGSLTGALFGTAAGWNGPPGEPANIDDVPNLPGFGRPGFRSSIGISPWNGESVDVGLPGEFTRLLPPGLADLLSSQFNFGLNRP
jgi:hypothetical protein